MMTQKKTGLQLLREPFPPHQISKLPKPYKRDSPKGKCAECGGYHGLPAVHLDYVGHAALTDRLLDCDPLWSWEPASFGPDGLPCIDKQGGLWIRLTVCGHSRLGYGHPDGKSGGDAIKEAIGDALRNAAMRFGAALDLWHKGDLHVDDEHVSEPPKQQTKPSGPTDEQIAHERAAHDAQVMIESAESIDDLASVWKALDGAIQRDSRVSDAKEKRKAQLTTQNADLGGDAIPYEGK